MLDHRTLETAINAIVSVAQEKILPELGPDQDLMPALFLLNDRGFVETVGALRMPDTADQRADFSRLVGDKLRMDNVPGYVALFMGWMSVCQPGEPSDRRPSEDPNRVETLVVQAGSHNAAVSRTYRAVRDDDKRLVHLELDNQSGAVLLQVGIFVDLLGSGPATVH